MGTVAIIVVIAIGVGLVLGGRSSRSLFKQITGGTLTVIGVCLFLLMVLAEAKKSGVI